jgi:hypothetical protein
VKWQKPRNVIAFPSKRSAENAMQSKRAKSDMSDRFKKKIRFSLKKADATLSPPKSPASRMRRDEVADRHKL